MGRIEDPHVFCKANRYQRQHRLGEGSQRRHHPVSRTSIVSSAIHGEDYDRARSCPGAPTLAGSAIVVEEQRPQRKNATVAATKVAAAAVAQVKSCLIGTTRRTAAKITQVQAARNRASISSYQVT
jgi:hypothetical protein